jgi:hypothetical protein
MILYGYILLDLVIYPYIVLRILIFDSISSYKAYDRKVFRSIEQFPRRILQYR